MLEFMETVNTRNISLVTTDIKKRKLIGMNREIMKEALKTLKIGAQVLSRRSNAMSDILLATEDAVRSWAGSILLTKIVRLQTEYVETRKTNVTLHGDPFSISEDHLGCFFSQFDEVSEVSSVISKTGIAKGDMEIWVTVTRKNFM